MFKFYCQNSSLVNWILDQVNYRSGVIFPKRRGWEAFIHLWRHAGVRSSFFVVVVSKNNEKIAFIPLDESSPIEAMPLISRSNFYQQIFGNRINKSCSTQLIFLTTEKKEKLFLDYFKKNNIKKPLLVLNSEKVSFVRGCFKNERLQYRLDQLKFDPELIPNLFKPDLGEANRGIGRALFYQEIFHVLCGRWIRGDRQPLLKAIIRQSVPFWNLVGKNERKELLLKIEFDLHSAFEKLHTEFPRIFKYQKKTSSLPETIIQMPEPPATKKEMLDWLKIQGQLLKYLSDDTEQVTIDNINLTLSS